VPTGDDWQHEIKFDGFRVQIHKLDDDVELYSRNGGRFSRRYPMLVDILRELPVKSAIIEGEIEKHGLEGVVSKRRDAPYRSGACRGWRKVKTMTWRQANRDRWRLFEGPGR
jgi:ATP-dependent DNA ligase